MPSCGMCGSGYACATGADRGRANSYVRKPVDFTQFVDATKQLGVDVPNFTKDQVAVSGIVLSADSAGTVSPQIADVLPVAPQPRRTFAAGHDVEAFWTTETRLTTRFDPSRAVDEHFKLPLERCPAGDYVLVVKVAADRFATTRQIRFSRH